MKVFFITLLLMLSVSSTACAFEVQIDGLWYDLNPETKEAEVINCQDDNSYSGEISIPMSLKHQKTTYTITGIESPMGPSKTVLILPQSHWIITHWFPKTEPFQPV